MFSKEYQAFETYKSNSLVAELKFQRTAQRVRELISLLLKFVHAGIALQQNLHMSLAFQTRISRPM